VRERSDWLNRSSMCVCATGLCSCVCGPAPPPLDRFLHGPSPGDSALPPCLLLPQCPACNAHPTSKARDEEDTRCPLWHPPCPSPFRIHRGMTHATGAERL
jgi:hypothetical protein